MRCTKLLQFLLASKELWKILTQCTGGPGLNYSDLEVEALCVRKVSGVWKPLINLMVKEVH